MKPRSLLLVAPDADLRHVVEETLLDMPVEVTSVCTEEEARRALVQVHPEIAVVADALPDNGSLSVCHAIRAVYQREPFQIVLVVTSATPDLLERAINGLIDDFYMTSAPTVELKLRVQAALRRIADHGTISSEREYYRRAARQEEELTSRILDQTLVLRKQFQTLEEESLIDSVTGLLRRGALISELDVEVERALRSLNTLSGFLTAPDLRTPLRESYGPEAARRLFAQLGKIFLGGLRKYDVCGLLAEETVFVALPGTDLHRARIVAERFSAGLSRLGAQSGSVAGAVSFSFGVSMFNEGESRDQWLGRSQTTLERARQLGGGRIEAVETAPDAYRVWKATRRKPTEG